MPPVTLIVTHTHLQWQIQPVLPPALAQTDKKEHVTSVNAAITHQQHTHTQLRRDHAHRETLKTGSDCVCVCVICPEACSSLPSIYWLCRRPQDTHPPVEWRQVFVSLAGRGAGGLLLFIVCIYLLLLPPLLSLFLSLSFSLSPFPLSLPFFFRAQCQAFYLFIYQYLRMLPLLISSEAFYLFRGWQVELLQFWKEHFFGLYCCLVHFSFS